MTGDSGKRGASTVVKASEVDLGYGGRPALKDVSIEIRAGEFWTVIGPQESGKSLLVKSLLGIVKPLRGAVQLNPAFRSRERVGYVPQRAGVPASVPTTVRELVLLGLTGTETGDKDIEAFLEEALTKVGLADAGSRSFHALSAAARRRALVARALVRRPRLVIADEPTDGLDPAGREALIRTLGAFNRDERTTVVLVSHDLDLVADFATHAAIVGGGRVATGSAEGLLTPERVEQAYKISLAGY